MDKAVAATEQEQSKKEEIIIDSMSVDFGCARRRDRDRDRDRDGCGSRPVLDLSNLSKEELKKRVEYSF